MGAVAGAVGVVALKLTTYGDMVVRRRPPSTLPAEVAADLAARMGIDLGSGVEGRHAKDAAGAILGIADGITLGCLYGLVRGRREPRPGARDAFAMTGVALLPEAVPAALGLSDPRDWTAADWILSVVARASFAGALVGTYRWLLVIRRTEWVQNHEIGG